MPKNDFTKKIIDFDTFTKIAWECWRFGQINCCQRIAKVAQSPINRPIWSHCLRWSYLTSSEACHKNGTIVDMCYWTCENANHKMTKSNNWTFLYNFRRIRTAEPWRLNVRLPNWQSTTNSNCSVWPRFGLIAIVIFKCYNSCK